jgi:hypothetical protein
VATHKSKTPGTLKEVLSDNVRHQQRRSNAIKDAEKKRTGKHA